MNVTNKMIFRNWILILTLMLVGFVIIGLGIIISGNILTQNATNQFYEFNISEKKELLKLEITNRLDEIEYERQVIVSSEKQIIENKIKSVYLKLLESKVPNHDLEAVIKMFDDIVSEDPYLFFAINTQGILMKSDNHTGLLGDNLIDNVDLEGRYFIREMIKSVENSEGVFLEYYWPKEKGGLALKKISYCLYLPEFEIIIGTGRYHEDLTKELQNKIYKRLQEYYAEKERYIFVNAYDSTALVSGISGYVGGKMSNLTDLNGKSIHEEIMNIITYDQEGYYKYQFIKKNDKQLSEKISYVHELHDWNAYIGIGFYTDSINKKVDVYNDYFKKYFYNEVLFVVIGLILIALMIFALIQKGTFLQKKYLEQDDIIFEKLFDFSDQGILVISNSGKNIYQNDKTKELFSNSVDDFIHENILKLGDVDANTFKINSKIKTSYVQLKTEKLSFRGLESVIYFIKDVSAIYLQSNKLEKMAFVDALTKLPNRHALNDDYTLLQSKPPMTAPVVGIIDIDYFKVVNDKYGHATGDKVLITLAKTFTSRLRQTDKLYRYGGEEFIVIMNNIDIEPAKDVLSKINLCFAKNTSDEFGFSITFSGGLISMKNITHIPLDEYINEADQLLYKAKNTGRNKIETKT